MCVARAVLISTPYREASLGRYKYLSAEKGSVSVVRLHSAHETRERREQKREEQGYETWERYSPPLLRRLLASAASEQPIF